MPSVEMVRGVEFAMGWRFKSDQTTPKPLDGYNVLVQMRPYDRSDIVIDSWTSTSPELTFTPANGAVDLLLRPSTTLAYDFKTAVIDCWVFNTLNTDGDRSPLYTVNLSWGSSRI